MKYIVSVSKAYKHRGYHQHKRAKKHWFVYYYDYDAYDEFRFCTKQVNWLQALYYMMQKKHRYKFVCEECGSVLLAVVKSFKDKIECPYCS